MYPEAPAMSIIFMLLSSKPPEAQGKRRSVVEKKKGMDKDEPLEFTRLGRVRLQKWTFFLDGAERPKGSYPSQAGLMAIAQEAS